MHNFKPGDLALIVGAFCIPQNIGKTVVLEELLGDGQISTWRDPADGCHKAIYDGLNGVVWRDDVQVVDAIVRKRYAETPCVRVRIVPLMTEEAA